MDQTYNKQKELQAYEETQRRNKLHDELWATRTLTKQNNLIKSEKLINNWKITQQIKKTRQIKDLNYENYIIKNNNLKQNNINNILNKQQYDGINNFTKNLKILGLNDGSIEDDNNGKPLTTIYEDSNKYLERIQLLNNKLLPKNEEINNYLIQLKTRTNAIKEQRHEKEKRKRRLLVQQQLFEEKSNNI